MKSIANEVVATAREYLGTRWHHQGRQKGVGVDCIGLVICVAHELALSTFDTTNYARTPDGVSMRRDLDREMEAIPLAERAAGDVLLMRFAEQPQHVAILTDLGDRPGIIHAHSAARKVVEHGLDALWESRIIQCYRFKNSGQLS